MARAFIEDIPESRFTSATIRRMYELVDRAKTDDKFQKVVYGVVGNAMPGQWKDYRRELETVFDWFKRRHDYRRDPVNVELLQDVWATLDRRRFDCDDGSIFLASACEVLGAPARFVTVSTRPNGEPSHVYVECFASGRWSAMDPSVQWSAFGWEPTGATNRRVWSRSDVGLSGGDESSVEGLGMNLTDDGILARRNGKLRVDEVSHTRANPIPGEAFVSARYTPSDDVSMTSDPHRTLLPGGAERYSVARSIRSHQTPAERFREMPGNPDDYTLDPNAAAGRIPTWATDPNAILPIPRASEDDELKDVAGLGKYVARQVAKRMCEECARRCQPGRGFNSLGAVEASQEIAADAPKITSAIVGSVQSGEIPKETSLIGQAINLAVSLWAAKQAIKAMPKPAAPAPAYDVPPTGATVATGYPTMAYGPAMPPALPAPPKSDASKWLVPAAVVAALVAVGGMMR